MDDLKGIKSDLLGGGKTVSTATQVFLDDLRGAGILLIFLLSLLMRLCRLRFRRLDLDGVFKFELELGWLAVAILC